MAKFHVDSLTGAGVQDAFLSGVAPFVVVSNESVTDIIGPEHERRKPQIKAFCPTRTAARDVVAALNSLESSPAAELRNLVSPDSFQSRLEDLLSRDSRLLLQFEILVQEARKKMDARVKR
ncbi:MAG TPA: hypothetical protein VGL56_15890 [Fimbriimonadaceae bacterium]|jgi:hypothetical protein